ncbi:extracellular solute-binding protein [Paenibacillus allorhizosphaerae]|uniref:Lipoprotein LipO n=1 Tax=Paenibacillus allorhizosphaerae TaxID=2849866 RepID=A0ABM8VEG8_9BACL|nr:extracellular solute-binding protein [Paenibacillus allorhizosphaerae]CAG7628863.1 Lipoprotein LipO [Paenibacillus allorhizosphaerae]
MIRTKKTFASLFAVSLFTTVVVAGCGGPQESGTAAGSSGAPKNLNILLSHSNAKYAMQVKDDDRYIKELSKLSGYNLKFEFLGHGNDFTQQMTVRFASGDLPDLVRTDSINSTMHPGAVDKGVFQDLTPLIEKYGQNLKKKIPEEAWKSPRVSKDGKIYGIPALSALPASRVVYIRQDWLDKLGMKAPKTVDDFLKFFEAVKKEDMNGNGDPNDEYGFYVRENLIYSNLFFTEFGAEPGTWYFKNGKLEPGMIQPEIKDALKFWKSLYDKGYINPNLFTNKAADWEAGIKQGKGGMWVHDVTNYNSNWGLPEYYVNEKNAKVSMVSAAEGPKGKGISPQSDQIYFVWVVPAKNKNAEDVIKFLNWAWSDEAEQFFALGIKDYNYKMENNKPIWNLTDPANKDNDASVFYQLSINPRGDGRMLPKLLDVIPNSGAIKEGIKTAAGNVIKNDALHMPTLESLKTHPELAPGTGTAGTLFLDMFAKTILGKEDVDSAFDKFVAEWKRRGGDAAIKEATDWYNNFHKK